MADNHPPTHEWPWYFKLITFMIGVSLGIAAKLANMHKSKPIMWRDVVVNSAIAFASAYLVWAALYYSGHINLAFSCAVLCGRFADDILKVAWKIFKTALSAANDEVQHVDND